MRKRSYSEVFQKKTSFFRCAFILSLLFVLQHSSAAINESARLTIVARNELVKNVLKQIEQKAQVHFMYEENVIPKGKRVSMNATNLPLSSVLNDLCGQTNLSYEIKKEYILLTQKPAKAEIKQDNKAQFTITGIVSDDQGVSLPGATVRINGQDKGTITDIDGKYSIKVSEGDILLYSYVGMKPTRVTVKNNKPINASLSQNTEDLGEVVVTGYQTISKERATGSFDIVKSDIISNRSVSNLSNALEGVVAGVQGKTKEDGSVDFLIRGAGSLYANRKPLIVVNGFPVQDDFTNINPNDVESITVLKDAAAASIWGARSANGVIVITTKQAKNKDKINVNINSFVKISEKTNLDQVFTNASSADHIRYEQLAFDNGWMFNEYSGSFNDVRKSLTLAQEQLFAYRNGQITKEQMNSELSRLSGIDNRQQLRDELFRNEVLQQYNISISRGGDRSQNYVSFLYENDLGGMKGNSYDRWMVNLNNKFNLTKWLTANLDATIQQRSDTRNGATLSEISELSPYELLLNENGSYATNLKIYNREQMATLPMNQFVYNDWSYNLLRETRSRELNTKQLRFRIQAGLNFKLYEGLTFDTKFQYEDGRTNASILYGENSFYTRNQVNFYSEYDQVNNKIGNKYLPKGAIFDREDARNYSYVFRNQLSYKKTFHEKHDLSALIGTEISNYYLDENVYQTVYGFDPKRNTSSFPQLGYNKVKNFVNDTYNTTIPGATAAIKYRNDRYASFYGNVGYNYDNRYGASFSIRSDASNLITDDPRYRWAPLWSLGGMWNIAEEDFMKDISRVNRLTARLTYGKNGNVEKSTSPKPLISMSSSPSSTTETITGSVADYGNPNLRWEVTKTVNVGVDYGLFNNKLTGKLDFYNKKGTDIIGLVEIAGANGTKKQKFNNAAILNRGFEFEVGTNQVFGKVAWTSNATYAYNKNKVLSLYSPSVLAYDLFDGAFVEGAPIGSVYSYTYLGMIDGVPYVTGIDREPTSMNDLTTHNTGKGLEFLNFEGTNIPPHTFGWNNSFMWNNFDMSILFVGEFGAKLRMPTFNYASVGSSKSTINKFVADVFAGSNNVPGFPLPNEGSYYRWSRYYPNLNTMIESASYISCKEINLGYSLPAVALRKMHISKLRFFAQIKDLGMIWTANSEGYDPNWMPGTNRPNTTYTLGFNLQF